MNYPKKLFPFTSRFVEIEDARIHYIDEGNGLTILFCHAAVGSSFMYRDMIKELSVNFRCIAFDFPGFGLSTESKIYAANISDQGRFIHSFVDKLDLKPVIGLGHDTGGPSLCLAAGIQPERFQRFILTDTLLYPPHEYFKIKWMLKFIGSDILTWLNAKTNFLIEITYRFGVRTRKLTAEERNVYRRMFNTKRKRRRINQVLHSLLTERSAIWQIQSSILGNLRSKQVLLMFGQKDPVAMLGIPQRLANAFENSRIEFIENEGHFPHEAQGVQMSHLIIDWIEDDAKAPQTAVDLDKHSLGKTNTTS